MYFNSLTFGLFLPVTLAAFWLLPARLRVAVLLMASYVFYSWWDYRFLSLIVVSTVTDYLIGRQLPLTTSARRRRLLLSTSVVVNIGLLSFFKYWGFFVESGQVFLERLGLEPNLPLLQVILPVGISFYTFQTLSYTIDVYRGRLSPEQHFLRFALFVAFFPQLIAGPIERASRLLPQIRGLPRSMSNIAWGEAGALIARGLFRKVVIADGVAPIVNQVFGAPERWNVVTVIMGIVAFSLQIYGDFSGYTDIARGVAKLFGIDLMENFRAPYFSRGFSEFWRRWHISLSTWLRDYLYIPLGGNRGTSGETYRNLMITMLLGGLWHGAAWGFVVWGGLHGLYLALERAANARRSGTTSIRLSAPIVFAIVSITWIPFRAPTLTAAGEMLAGLARVTSGDQLMFAPIVLAVLGLLAMGIDLADVGGHVDPIGHWPQLARGLGYGAAILAVFLFASQAAVPFVYFQF